MSETIPSKFVTVSVSYGEKKAHLHATDDLAWEWHATEKGARDAIKENLASGDKMVALLRVEALFKAKPVQIEEIK